MRLFPASLPLDHERIVAAIRGAEQRTSGEIRVVVAQQSTEDPVGLARREFERLGMTATAARNGVLILLAPASRSFAVIGDTGVHEKCGAAFWDALAGAMRDHFQRGDFTAGVVLAIERAGELLATHFPRSPDDRNELSDRIEETH